MDNLSPLNTPVEQTTENAPLVSTRSPSKLPNIFLIVGGIVLLAVVGGGGYYLGMNQNQGNSASQINMPPTVSQNDGENTVCTMDAKICPDGSSVGRGGPNCEFEECPTTLIQKKEWVRETYGADETVVWNVLHPQDTSANKNGLPEGYLALNSNDGGKNFMSEFYFPRFEEGVPSSVDEWTSDVVESELNMNFTDVSVTSITHTQNVPIRMIKSTAIAPGGIKTGSMPMFFLYIWEHTNSAGRMVNPSIITVKPNSDPDMDAATLEEFTKKLALGLRF